MEALLGFYLHKHSFDIGCVQKIEVRGGFEWGAVRGGSGGFAGILSTQT